MDNSLELLTKLPTKAEAQSIVDNITSLVDAGEVSALEIAVKLKFLEQVAKDTKEAIRENIQDEVGKYAKGESITSLGAKIEPCEAGISYDYSQCQHEEYNLICEKKKEIEAMLKSLKAPLTTVDETTGETFKWFPPQRKSTSTIKITLNK